MLACDSLHLGRAKYLHASVPFNPPAWTLPFGVLRTPVVDGTLPDGDWRARFISFNNPAAQNVPTAWCWGNPQPPPTNGCKGATQVMPSNSAPFDPLGGVSATSTIYCTLLTRVDSETAGLAAYFNMQAVIEGDVNNPPSYVRWSNLQSEYR